MQAELKLLEDNVASLISLCKQLQRDNAVLKEELRLLGKKNTELEEKVDKARMRIEHILTHLPGVENVR